MIPKPRERIAYIDPPKIAPIIELLFVLLSESAIRAPIIEKKGISSIPMRHPTSAKTSVTLPGSPAT